MKMEVLSVQNQYQGQFGVIGSSKVKDWTSPLTPPPPPPIRSHPRNHHNNSSNTHSVDTVDGPTHAQQPPNNRHQAYSNQHQAAMEASSSIEVSSGSRFTYNNNLLCCEHTEVNNDGRFVSTIDDIDAAAVDELSQRLQAELRAAKSRHLACTEVSLPWDLTPRIAAEIIKSSEKEPCGVRGCSVFIEFEDEPNNTRRIASFKVDPNTVSTFELYLTLKHDKRGWSLDTWLPQFLKNLTRSSTILISPDFSLTKNKLYSCE